MGDFSGSSAKSCRVIPSNVPSHATFGVQKHGVPSLLSGSPSSGPKLCHRYKGQHSEPMQLRPGTVDLFEKKRFHLDVRLEVRIDG